MARPKINTAKKRMINLSISEEAREMADYIRTYESISISEFLEKCIQKEYQKLANEEKKKKRKADEKCTNSL